MNLELIVQDLYQPSVIEENTWVDWFQTWLEIPGLKLPPADTYELSLTTDAEIQALNAQFRQQDRPTDVLSFAAMEVDFPEIADDNADLALYLGDIIISVDTAAIQAPEHGYSLRKELAWLASHGLLHLLGWDHPDAASLSLMLEQQATFLTSSGI
jgi:probable rRNA maturation factor